MNELTVPGINVPMGAAGEGGWRVDGDKLVGEAAARTDLFVDPASGAVTVNAPRLLVAPPDGDFQLSARVEVAFAGTFDAAVLLLWIDERHWAKLCFEYSPAGEPMVVSVVTRDVSDDANSFTVSGSSVWLRVSRVGPAFAYHVSTDGAVWQLVRHFSLGAGRPDIGFEVQAPIGEGCTANFAAVSYAPTTLADLRDGT